MSQQESSSQEYRPGYQEQSSSTESELAAEPEQKHTTEQPPMNGYEFGVFLLKWIERNWGSLIFVLFLLLMLLGGVGHLLFAWLIGR